MLTVEDRKGREWAARLTLDAVVVLRDQGGIDVMAASADDAAERERVLGDPSFPVRALYLLCEPDIAPRKFGLRFRGLPADYLRHQWTAAIDAFFRAPGPPPKGGGCSRTWTASELWQEVYRIAGVVGFDPRPFTFGELVVMAEGKRRQLGELAAYLNSVHFDLKKVRIEDLDYSGGLKEARQRGVWIDPNAPKLSLGEFALALNAKPKPPKRFVVAPRDPDADRWPDEIRN